MTKILIADDERNILMLLEVILKDLNAEVFTAENGLVAIELAKKHKPDLVITDVIMPFKNGFEVCSELRNTPELAHIPVIILSALGDEYNKITGFEEGADDYVTKPFSVEELKARVKALLFRRQARSKEKTIVVSEEEAKLTFIPTGLPLFDKSLGGGLPRGSNILITGQLGSGKSSFSREVLVRSLLRRESALFVAIDDDPSRIRQKLDELLPKPVSEFESNDLLRMIDAYSWSIPSLTAKETFSLSGNLELNQLSGLIADAGAEIGQSVQKKMGGIRVIDSISSLLVHFDLAQAQRFINQIARTALAFGGVTTLFLAEEGTVSEQIINNIKYSMDCIIEIREHADQRQIRVSLMKWRDYSNQWMNMGGVE